ncbi:MAG: transcriptional regulator, partial [Chloroflexota bacterium]|nr:transcriptional regulator [Chloroflexota bacterium]
MVVDGRAGEDHADRIFRALADRTRRDIVRRAMGGTLSVSGLARLYPM